jgi:hypothetical protein
MTGLEMKGFTASLRFLVKTKKESRKDYGT